MSSKIAVTGAVEGRFVEVFEKIATLHAKNTFSFALIAGDLFKDPLLASPDDEAHIDALLNGRVKVALTTYFSLGKHALPAKVVKKVESDGDEICDNLIFLGKRTTIKTSEGVRIVALGGNLDSNLIVGTSKDKFTPFYSDGDAHALRGANSADILLTSQWPSSVRVGSKASTGTTDPLAYNCISDLNTILKPRYHFSTSETFFEREPFFHPSPENEDSHEYFVTRFISLAPYGNASKQKWIYAFSIDVAAKMSAVLTPGTTASPFTFLNKKRPAPSSGEFSRFDTQRDHTYQGRGKKRARQPPPGPGECFFCLSNPTLAAHLVTSIGTDAYLSTAKGPISDADTFKSLAFPSHMLIIPLAHAPTLTAIPEMSTRDSTIAEMRRYRNSLNAMVHATSGGELGSICWEVKRSSGIHAHWQFLPLPIDTIRRGLVEAAFKVEAQHEQYPSFKISQGSVDLTEPGDCFTVTTWRAVKEEKPELVEGAVKDEEGHHGIETTMTLPIDSSFRFDLQFGRRVLCKLLNLESRIQWRDCSQTEAEETADAEAFKEAWKNYDFNED